MTRSTMLTLSQTKCRVKTIRRTPRRHSNSSILRIGIVMGVRRNLTIPLNLTKLPNPPAYPLRRGIAKIYWIYIENQNITVESEFNKTPKRRSRSVYRGRVRALGWRCALHVRDLLLQCLSECQSLRSGFTVDPTWCVRDAPELLRFDVESRWWCAIDSRDEDGCTRRVCHAGYHVAAILQQLCRNGDGTGSGYETVTLKEERGKEFVSDERGRKIRSLKLTVGFIFIYLESELWWIFHWIVICVLCYFRRFYRMPSCVWLELHLKALSFIQYVVFGIASGVGCSLAYSAGCGWKWRLQLLLLLHGGLVQQRLVSVV